MLSSSTSYRQNHNCNTVTTFLRFIACFLFLICVAASPTFGQSYWSDNWLVSQAPDNNPADDPDELPGLVPGAYVAGCGATEDNYNTYGHEYSVMTTVTSPSGRTATISGGPSGSYSRADASLQLDSNEVGRFATDTIHSGFCPIGMSSLGPTNTSAGGIGLGLSAYIFVGQVGNSCSWDPTCFVGCTQAHTTNTFNGVCFTQGRIYRQCLDAYYYGACVTRRVICAGRLQPGFCRNG